MALFVKVTLWGRDEIYLNMDKVVKMCVSPPREASFKYGAAPQRTSIWLEGSEECIWVTESLQTIITRLYGNQR